MVWVCVQLIQTKMAAYLEWGLCWKAGVCKSDCHKGMDCDKSWEGL